MLQQWTVVIDALDTEETTREEVGWGGNEDVGMDTSNVGEIAKKVQEGRLK